MGAVNDVRLYLIAQEIIEADTEYSGSMREFHDNTDKLVVISEDGGDPPDMPATAGLGSAPFAFAGVLVTVRAVAAASNESYSKADEILRALHGLRAVQLVGGGVLYYGIRAMTPEPVFAGFDERGRPLHTVAFRLLTDAANL